MSSLDSSLNSMATVTTLDFYQKFGKKDGTAAHYLKASRWFTLFWAVLMVLPVIASAKVVPARVVQPNPRHANRLFQVNGPFPLH